MDTDGLRGIIEERPPLPVCAEFTERVVLAGPTALASMLLTVSSSCDPPDADDLTMLKSFLNACDGVRPCKVVIEPGCAERIADT
jgi:hypothetical protein